MLDFRYWNATGSSQQDMTAPDDIIEKLITDNHIGGVILFANNLKDKLQIPPGGKNDCQDATTGSDRGV